DMSGAEYGLGLSRTEVALRPYDMRWEEAFRRTEARLRGIVRSDAVAVEHIGSTAVPGLAAKPVLDVALAFPDRVSLDLAAGRLAAAGYERRGDFGDTGGVILSRARNRPGRRASTSSSATTRSGASTSASGTCSGVTAGRVTGTRL